MFHLFSILVSVYSKLVNLPGPTAWKTWQHMHNQGLAANAASYSPPSTPDQMAPRVAECVPLFAVFVR